MNRLTLAIPLASVFLISSLIPSRAQNFVDRPPAQIANNPTNSVPAPMTEEDAARLMLVHKQYREAEEIFVRLTKEQPKNAIYWNELGITRHSQSELGLALKCYQKAVKLDSQYPDALNNEGTIWYEQKQFGKAIRAYRKAIKLRGDFAPFYLNLGYAYFNQKNYEDSIASFRKALELDPAAFDASHSRMGTVIQDRSLSADRGHFYFMLAKSFAEAGNVERCVIYLKKARDEGYKDFNTVKSDPSFAAVLKDPAVQAAIEPISVGEAQQP